MTTAIKLHCPCGVVDVTVPVTIGSGGQLRSDPERQVSFVNVHCFASGIDVENALPPLFRWPELGERSFVTIDICYWGAFYCVIGEKELGFPNGLNASSVVELSRATERLKAALVADTKFKKLFQHADEKDLSFLYGMIVTDEKQGRAVDGTAGVETGLCFFASQQVDRSPCGSGVAARRALAHAKGLLPPEKRWTYQSLVSNAYDGQNAFTAHVVESPGHFRQRDPRKDSVRIRVALTTRHLLLLSSNEIALALPDLPYKWIDSSLGFSAEFSFDLASSRVTGRIFDVFVMSWNAVVKRHLVELRSLEKSTG